MKDYPKITSDEHQLTRSSFALPDKEHSFENCHLRLSYLSPFQQQQL